MPSSPRALRAALGGGLLLACAAAHAAPSVTRLTTPAGVTTTSAAPGDVLVIQGSGFGSATGEVWLDRGGYGREAEVLDWNGPGGLIRVRVPQPADLGELKLIVRSGPDGSDPVPLLLLTTPPPAPAPTTPLPPGPLADPVIRPVHVLRGPATNTAIPRSRL